MASAELQDEELKVPEVTVVGNPTTWKMDLPENHG